MSLQMQKFCKILHVAIFIKKWPKIQTALLGYISNWGAGDIDESG